MMKNIELAIELYENYITAHMGGDNSANVYEYLEPSGYTDLKEFHNDQQEYLLKHLDFKEIRESEINSETVHKMLDVDRPTFHFAYNTGEGIKVFLPIGFDDYDLLEQYDVSPVDIEYISTNGIIVSGGNDLRIVINIPNEIEIYTGYFLYKMRDYLMEYFPDVEIDHNDIMISGKKICGCVDVKGDKLHSCLFQITYSDNIELIESICGIRKKKVGYLNSNIVSQEQFKNEFLTWLQ